MLYFVSAQDIDGKTLKPRVPKNFLTINGYEDNTTKRVCFSTSIDGCLSGLSQNIDNKEFYVYTPYEKDIKYYKPKKSEVPDVMITKEVWVKEPVTIKCIGKIIAKDNGKNGVEYAYGDNKKAILYTWDYEWINKVNEKSEDYSRTDDNFKKKTTNDKFRCIDLDTNEALKFVDKKWRDPGKKGCIIIKVMGNMGDVAGYIYVKSEGDHKGVVGPLRVFNKYRGYGLSEILMKEAISKYGANKLGVYADNEVAIKLYKKMGFVIVGEKTRNGEKYYIMELKK